MNKETILEHLPYAPPFLFVDALEYIDDHKVMGSYTFQTTMPCYEGHFKGYPVTPGVLLTEVMAQIVACLGIYLLGNVKQLPAMAMTEMQIGFYRSIFPGETVKVKAEKVYFRFGKLKCRVALYNTVGLLACDGIIAGMITSKQHV